jgi:starch phosphorylase
MKVPVNGGINFSVIDGWWGEGYTGDTGWAIGRGEEYEDSDYQDEVESLALYDLLEAEIAPRFYRRDADGMPRDWVEMMKASMRTIIPVFNTHRMIEDYCEKFYLPASLQWKLLSSNTMAAARKLAAWKQRMASHWHEIQIVHAQAEELREYKVGEQMAIVARVRLGAIEPDDVTVEAVAGLLNARGEMVNGVPHRLDRVEGTGEPGVHHYRGLVPCTESGRHGFSLRILPCSRGLATSPFEMRLVHWWGDGATAPLAAAPV